MGSPLAGYQRADVRERLARFDLSLASGIMIICFLRGAMSEYAHGFHMYRECMLAPHATRPLWGFHYPKS
jgi:hypothetical protein